MSGLTGVRSIVPAQQSVSASGTSELPDVPDLQALVGASLGDDPLPTTKEAMDAPLSAFPSCSCAWNATAAARCACSTRRTPHSATCRSSPSLDRMGHDGCSGLAWQGRTACCTLEAGPNTPPPIRDMTHRACSRRVDADLLSATSVPRDGRIVSSAEMALRRRLRLSCLYLSPLNPGGSPIC
jgi:hypothetical protein